MTTASAPQHVEAFLFVPPLQRLRLNRFPVVSQRGYSSSAQANRITLALLCRFDDALGDDFTDQGGLSCVLNCTVRFKTITRPGVSSGSQRRPS